MIHRNSSPRWNQGRGKGPQNRLNPLATICQPAFFRDTQEFSAFPGGLRSRTQQALGAHDRFQAGNGLIELIVNQNVVVLVVLLNLPAGCHQSPLDHRFGVLATLAQSALQSAAIGRKDENTNRIWQLSLDLRRSLHVNIQQQIMTSVLRLSQETPGRAVIVAEDVGVFQKFVRGDHLFKFFAANKVILFLVLLASAWSSRRVRDRKIEIRNQFQQLGHQCGFTRTRRRGDDEDQRLVRNGTHSRFCTCSRDFSISAFMARPASVIFSASPARPEVFDSNVFASRFISWSKKSSFLPASPPASSNARK